MMKSLRLTVSSLAVVALTVGALIGTGVLPVSATPVTVTVTIAGINYTAESIESLSNCLCKG